MTHTVVFQSEGSKFESVIEVYDASGAVVFSTDAFTGVLGAK